MDRGKTADCICSGNVQRIGEYFILFLYAADKLTGLVGNSRTSYRWA